jgi:hypothetical protein
MHRWLRCRPAPAAQGAVEVLPHGHDVLALAFAPDGKQVASATLDGQIYFWDALEGVLQVGPGAAAWAAAWAAAAWGCCLGLLSGAAA